MTFSCQGAETSAAWHSVEKRRTARANCCVNSYGKRRRCRWFPGFGDYASSIPVFSLFPLQPLAFSPFYPPGFRDTEKYWRTLDAILHEVEHCRSWKIARFRVYHERTRLYWSFKVWRVTANPAEANVPRQLKDKIRATQLENERIQSVD